MAATQLDRFRLGGGVEEEGCRPGWIMLFNYLCAYHQLPKFAYSTQNYAHFALKYAHISCFYIKCTDTVNLWLFLNGV